MKRHALANTVCMHQGDRRSQRGKRARAGRLEDTNIGNCSHKASGDKINLEWFHRNAWRQYLAVFFLMISFGFAASGAQALADTKGDASPVAAKVSYDLGDDALPQTGKAEKLSTKTPAPAVADKQTSKDGEKKPVEKILKKTVKGSVAFIRRNKMAVAFAEDENGGQEILLSLDKGVKVQHVKNFAQIKPGDLVQVNYEETYLEPKEKGGEPTVLKMVGKEIIFLKSAPAPSAQTKVSMDDKGI